MSEIKKPLDLRDRKVRYEISYENNDATTAFNDQITEILCTNKNQYTTTCYDIPYRSDFD